MVKLKKPVTRESSGVVFDQGRLRPVLITIEPGQLITLRLKGTRRSYSMDAAALYEAMVIQAVAAEAKEKRKARRKK